MTADHGPAAPGPGGGFGPADVPGWYNFEPFYDRAVRDAPPGSLLIEVGVFCGRSLCDLALKARAADKGLRVVGVDHFRGSPEHQTEHANLSRHAFGSLAAWTLQALDKLDLLDYVTLVVAPSARAAHLFPDGAAWMVFLDAAHDEASVAADVDAWFPKVTKGGFLAGDDVWGFPGVGAAVRRAFPGIELDPARETWEVRK